MIFSKNVYYEHFVQIKIKSRMNLDFGIFAIKKLKISIKEQKFIKNIKNWLILLA
jgi:hypothetical protein